MALRFHYLGLKKSWILTDNLETNLKNTSKGTHIFICAPSNHGNTKGYERFKNSEYANEETVKQYFDIVWKSPVCINNSYSPTQPRNYVLICTVKKEFQ